MKTIQGLATQIACVNTPEICQFNTLLFLRVFYLPSEELRNLTADENHNKIQLGLVVRLSGFYSPVPQLDFKWMWFYSLSHLISEQINLLQDLISK